MEDRRAFLSWPTRLAGVALWLLAALWPVGAAAQAAPLLTWDALAVTVEPYDDPFLDMAYEHIIDLRIILDAQESEHAVTVHDAAAVEARARLEAAGLDPEYLLSQRLVVMERRREADMGVTHTHVGSDIMIDGYVLPLRMQDGLAVEFLLVPWVGACIHTPPPPANQMVHVTMPQGLEVSRRFDAVRLGGQLVDAPSEHDLFLVDGSRLIPSAYRLDEARVAGVPGEVVAASAAQAGIGPFARAQIWITELFTGAMAGMGQGGGFGALALAVLIAFSYGVLHTLGPGHGKAVVISYFAGAGGSLGRGLRMGVQIAITHVLSAVVLVFLLDLAVRQATGAAPSDYRAIRLASYGAIIAIGAVMLWQAVAALRAHRESGHHDHDHGHDDSHAHSGCAACTATRRQGHWLATAVGIVPCTGALIVMLFGLANDLVWPAVVMVIAISAGMALAMSAIGIAALWGRGLLAARAGGDGARLARFELGARLAGAAAVLAIGAALFTVTLTHGAPRAEALELAQTESGTR